LLDRISDDAKQDSDNDEIVINHLNSLINQPGFFSYDSILRTETLREDQTAKKQYWAGVLLALLSRADSLGPYNADIQIDGWTLMGILRSGVILARDNRHERWMEEKKQEVEIWINDTQDRINSIVEESKILKEFEPSSAHWRRRSKNHKIQGVFFYLLFLAFSFSIGGFAFSLLFFPDSLPFPGAHVFFAPPETANDWVTPAKRIILLTTVLGLAVWITRQLLKLASVHYERSADASDRVTMIETFAALRAGQGADINPDPMIQSLFRPSSGAFSPEDGGPLLTAEIVQKLIPK